MGGCCVLVALICLGFPSDLLWKHPSHRVKSIRGGRVGVGGVLLLPLTEVLRASSFLIVLSAHSLSGVKDMAQLAS